MRTGKRRCPAIYSRRCRQSCSCVLQNRIPPNQGAERCQHHRDYQMCRLAWQPSRQAGATAATPAGTFDSHGDVGTVLHPGSVEYDSAKRSYTIAGSGENIWLGSDAFQFAWKKLSGDITLTADITFLGKGVNEHRKAVLMIRQNLDADSPYVDVALHGSGLTSLQYREEKGAATHEIQADI